MGAGAITWYRIYSLEQLGFFLLRGPSNNNRIQAHSGLILNSYEEILGRKGVRKRGASGAVSWDLCSRTHSSFSSYCS